jgi:hypothetical protein
MCGIDAYVTELAVCILSHKHGVLCAVEDKFHIGSCGFLSLFLLRQIPQMIHIIRCFPQDNREGIRIHHISVCMEATVALLRAYVADLRAAAVCQDRIKIGGFKING